MAGSVSSSLSTRPPPLTHISYAINYFTEIAPISDATGAALLAGAQGCFALGRFSGSFLMRFIRPRYIFLFYLSSVIAFCSAAIQERRNTGIAMFMLTLYFESVCFSWLHWRARDLISYYQDIRQCSAVCHCLLPTLPCTKASLSFIDSTYHLSYTQHSHQEQLNVGHSNYTEQFPRVDFQEPYKSRTGPPRFGDRHLTGSRTPWRRGAEAQYASYSYSRRREQSLTLFA